MKIITGILLLMSTFSLYAEDCGPETKSQKNVLITYVECQLEQKNCLEFKDVEGGKSQLDKTSRAIFKIKTASYEGTEILMEFDDVSACRFEKVTEKNTGKRMAIMNGKIILSMPQISSPIKGGKIQLLMMGKDTSKICKKLFGKCKEVKQPKVEIKKGSFSDMMTNPPIVSVFEMNKKYGQIMESFWWVTDKSVLMTYKTSELKEGTPYYVAMMGATDKIQGTPLFYGEQEYDEKTQKFIYTSDAVKIDTHGWIKREDLAPHNVLADMVEEKKRYVSFLFVKSCPQLLKNFSGDQQNLEAFKESYLKYNRSFEIALCALDGEVECKAYFKQTADEVAKVSCDDLFKAMPK